MNDTPRVEFEPPIFEWTCHWQPSSSKPNHNGPVYGFCPDLGNEDEGYGMILIVRSEHLWPDNYWIDAHGARVRVTWWAEMRYPRVPDGWVRPPAQEESQE